MSNPPGTPIWYELVTPDPDGATGFYEHVVGWKIGEPPTGAPDYRMIGVPGGAVGGVLPLTDDMKAAGARPTWLLYLGVEDVDATAEKALSIGAHIFVPPTDIPGVGRFALLADPQGAPFYIMRSDSDQTSTAYAPGKAGHPRFRRGIGLLRRAVRLGKPRHDEYGANGRLSFPPCGLAMHRRGGRDERPAGALEFVFYRPRHRYRR